MWMFELRYCFQTVKTAGPMCLTSELNRLEDNSYREGIQGKPLLSRGCHRHEDGSEDREGTCKDTKTH